MSLETPQCFFTTEPETLRLFGVILCAIRLHHARVTAPNDSTKVFSAVSNKKQTLLLRIRRSKVNVVRAQATVDAVR